MIDKENLIREITDAICDAHESGLSRGYLSESRPHHSDSEVYARAALSVFEKAHTPTDDGREAPTDEALRDFGNDLLDAWNIEDTNSPSLIEDFRDRFVARFRRSEVPEPSTEMIAPEDGMTLEELGEAISNWSPEWDGDEAMHALIYRFIEHYSALDAEVYAAREEHDFEPDAEILFRYDDEAGTLVRVATEPQGEPSDAQLPLDDSEQCRKCKGYACDCASTLSAEQFEDVQIHEALRAAHEDSTGIAISYEAMRAALRAANEIR